jgi:hypothetical protein
MSNQTKITFHEKGAFLNGEKKVHGRLCLLVEGTQFWLQIENPKSEKSSPEVLRETQRWNFQEVLDTSTLPDLSTGTLKSNLMLKFSDGSSRTLGPFDERDLRDFLSYLNPGSQTLYKCDYPTKPGNPFEGIASKSTDWIGSISFTLSDESIRIHIDKNADVAIQGFSSPQNDEVGFVAALENELTFDIEPYSGDVTTVKKSTFTEARMVGTAIFGLASILVPLKKIDVTQDTRTLKVSLTGTTWKIYFVTPITFLRSLEEFRGAIQKSTIRLGLPAAVVVPPEHKSTHNGSIVNQIAEASKLLADGLITQEEFSQIKMKIINANS